MGDGTQLWVFRIIMDGQHFEQSVCQTGAVANPGRGRLDGENYFFPLAPENLVSRVGFGRPVPRQPASSPHPG